jgi:hypothetical protein
MTCSTTDSVLVLRFPDPGSAADVAKPLADLQVGDTPARPLAIPRYPDAIGRTYDPQSGATSPRATFRTGPTCCMCGRRPPTALRVGTR